VADVIDIDERRPKPPRVKLTYFDDLELATDSRYLVKGLLARTGLAVVWGPPKSGKSFWTFDVMMHVAMGWKYRGRLVQPGPVVYCAFEGQFGLQARCEAFRQRFLADDRPHIPFIIEETTLDLVREHGELIAAVSAKLGEVRPVAVVLDTLNRSMVGSESNDEDMAAYIRAADAIREAFDCLVVIVHHCGIDGNRPRGHTSLSGAVDTQISVKRDMIDNVVCTVELNKDGPQGEEVLSRLEVVQVGFDDDADQITSCVIVPSDDAVSIKLRGPKLTGHAKTALGLLNDVVDEDGEPSPRSSPFVGADRVVHMAKWRTKCMSGLAVDLAEHDARKKAFARALSRLQDLNLIGVYDVWVWPT
jgi:hypothetical protein